MDIAAAQEILRTAAGNRQQGLSEYDSRRLIAAYGIPVAAAAVAATWEEVRSAAEDIGYPVVLKLCGVEISHKSEKGLIAVDLRRPEELAEAFQRLDVEGRGSDTHFMVQEMVRGSRELVVGMVRDPQFGPCVMYGLGGILTELLNDVSFRVAPLEMVDAMEMMEEIKGHKILDAIRGMPPADREAIARCLVALGEIGMAHEEVQEIDVNPLILQGSRPVAVDALVVLQSGADG